MKEYVVVDIETTGTQPLHSDIIEIGAVYIKEGQVVGKFSELVCPTQEISEYITGITGITNELVKDARCIEEVLPVKATRLGLLFQKQAVDTLILARKFLKDLPSRRLGDLCTHYRIELTHAHRAYDDAYATYELYCKLNEAFYTMHPEAFEPEMMTWEMPKWVGITPKQSSFLKALSEKYEVALEQPIHAYSKSEASRLIDKIISEYGRL